MSRRVMRDGGGEESAEEEGFGEEGETVTTSAAALQLTSTVPSAAPPPPTAFVTTLTSHPSLPLNPNSTALSNLLLALLLSTPSMPSPPAAKVATSSSSGQTTAYSTVLVSPLLSQLLLDTSTPRPQDLRSGIWLPFSLTNATKEERREAICC